MAAARARGADRRGRRTAPAGGRRGQRGQVGPAGVSRPRVGPTGQVVAGRGALVVGQQGVVADPGREDALDHAHHEHARRGRGPTAASIGPTSTPWPNRLVPGRRARRARPRGPGGTWSGSGAGSTWSSTPRPGQHVDRPRSRAWCSSARPPAASAAGSAQEAVGPPCPAPPGGRAARLGDEAVGQLDQERAQVTAAIELALESGRRRRSVSSSWRRRRRPGRQLVQLGPARPRRGRGGRATPSSPVVTPASARDARPTRVAGTGLAAPATRRMGPPGEPGHAPRRGATRGRAGPARPAGCGPPWWPTAGARPAPLVGMPARANDSCSDAGVGVGPAVHDRHALQGDAVAVAVHDARARPAAPRCRRWAR